MKVSLCRLALLLALVALIGSQPGLTPAGGPGLGGDDIEKKLQTVRQQLEELRKQEQALLKQQ